jgi:hypothetical protein
VGQADLLKADQADLLKADQADLLKAGRADLPENKTIAKKNAGMIFKL